MILSLYVSLHFILKSYDIYAFVSDFFSQYNDFNIHSYCVIHSFFFISTYYLTIRRYHTVLFIHPLMNIWIIFCLWSPEKESGYPLQYSCLGNPMDRGAWWATVHRVAKSWTQLSTHTQLSETSLIFLKDLMLPWSLLLPPSLDNTIHKTTSSLGCFWLHLAVSSIQTVSQGTYYLS